MAGPVPGINVHNEGGGGGGGRGGVMGTRLPGTCYAAPYKAILLPDPRLSYLISCCD